MQQTSSGQEVAFQPVSEPLSESHTRNSLLSSLSPPALAELRPHLETVRLELGDVLFDAHQTVTDVHFLESAGVMLTSVDQGRTTSAGTIGCEGMLGVGIFLGVDTSFLRAATYLPGTARRMNAAAFRRLATGSGPMHEIMLEYSHSFLTQVIAEQRCNSAHDVVQRCARWLLLTSQRAGVAELPLDLDLLALAIAAQRGGVSLGVRALEQSGLIDCRDGRVYILDHRALAEAACACARTIPRP